MSFNVLRKFLISLLLLNYIVFYPQAQSAEKKLLKGAELSLYTEQLLEKSDFSFQRIELAPTGNDIFAFNINVRLEPSLPAVSAKTMLILVSQEDFFEYLEEILSLVEKTKKIKRAFPVEFVFTALDDRNNLFPEYKFFLQGTENFAGNLDDGSEYFAVLINFSKNTKAKAEIFTTGGKSSTPMWLAKETVDSFLSKNIPFSVPQKLLSIYRAGLLFGDEQMAAFFKEGVPCIKLQFSKVEQISALENFIQNHIPSQNEKNDVHYSFITLANHTFWINEFKNILSVEIFGILVILFLVCFTFTGKNRLQSKKDFSRYWLFIPAMLCASVFSLYAGQFCCKNLAFIAQANPVIQFAAKLFISVIVISVFFLFQVHLKLPVTSFIYGFMIILVSAANIFLFSMADITVFWVFALEYFIIYFTRNSSKLLSLIITFSLMLLPFLSYVAVYFANVNAPDIKILISSGKQVNIMLSLILFPFQIVWLKILVRLRVLNKDKSLSLKKIAGFTFISAAIIVAVITLFAFLTTEFVYNKKHDFEKPQILEDSTKKNLFCKIFNDDSSMLRSSRLKIKSKKQAVRCSVNISSEKNTPVLDSNYSYLVLNNSKTADFNIPDFPPQNFEIEFSTEKNTSKIVTITSFYATENQNEFEKETVSIFVSGDKAK
ncbi:hypothetical protein [Treponema berlinense]|uniref:hypothetical protein n=1 Tax=Treponema berlinense TaxID=225004 RepID=UPI003FD81981